MATALPAAGLRPVHHLLCPSPISNGQIAPLCVELDPPEPWVEKGGGSAGEVLEVELGEGGIGKQVVINLAKLRLEPG